MIGLPADISKPRLSFPLPDIAPDDPKGKKVGREKDMYLREEP